MKLDVVEHLFDAGVDRAGRGDGIDVPVGHLHQPACIRSRCGRSPRSGRGAIRSGMFGGTTPPDVRQGGVVRRRQIPHRRVRPRHPQRPKDAFADQIVPRSPGALFDQIARGHEHQVLILPTPPERGVRLDVVEALIQFLATEAGPVPQQVVPRQSGPVRDQVTRRHRFAGEFVVQLKVREVLADRLVPVELARIHEHAHQHDGERFAVGSDRHQRARRDRQLVVDIPEAVPLEEHDAAVLDDPQSEPRDVPLRHHRRNELIESSEGTRGGAGSGARLGRDAARRERRE